MKSKIAQFIAEDLNGTPDLIVTGDEDLLSAGLVDSMGMMRLIEYVESIANIKVDPQDMTIDNFMTIDAILEFAASKKS